MGRIIVSLLLLVVLSGCAIQYTPEYFYHPVKVGVVKVEGAPIDSFEIQVPAFKGVDVVRFRSTLTESTDVLEQIYFAEDDFLLIFKKGSCSYAVVKRNGGTVSAWIKDYKCEPSIRADWNIEITEFTSPSSRYSVEITLFSNGYVYKSTKIYPDGTWR